MIYTSYFSMLKNIPKEYIPVSIAFKTPEFYKGLIYKKLAPTPDILYQYKKDGDWERYEKFYEHSILSLLLVNEVLTDLLNLTSSYDIVLLCYEKGNCHRHIVRQWFKNQGVNCEEFKVNA